MTILQSFRRFCWLFLLLPLIILLVCYSADATAFQSSPRYSTKTIATTRTASSSHFYGLTRMFPQEQQVDQSSSPLTTTTTTILRSTNGDKDDDISSALAIGLLVPQPIVWISLYFVVTTGGGLPAGPFGLLGATEGISYLVVVGIVAWSIYKKITTGSGLPSGPGGLLGAAEGLSFLTILAGLGALGSLVVDQGCVPNAKPLLDYSAYVKVCNPEETPGLFGGS